MDFLAPEIEQYALEHSQVESTLLNDLNRQTHLNILKPRMLSGHLQGRILSMLSQSIQPKTILEIADSICQEAGVPFELVYEIGKNESNWTFIKNSNGGSDFGDLQVIDQTYWYWYKHLNLKGGKTRKNYLKVGIYYLKYLHNKYGTWEKARFAYGRGHWREPYTWTRLEKKFMRKIDFSKYDLP